jgi:hypothetical protein
MGVIFSTDVEVELPGFKSTVVPSLSRASISIIRALSNGAGVPKDRLPGMPFGRGRKSAGRQQLSRNFLRGGKNIGAIAAEKLAAPRFRRPK